MILGDLPASYFSVDQIDWMVQQVNRLGASLLMLGGSLHSPQSYAGTPLEALLPVSVEGSVWERVGDDVVASPTEEGLSGQIATLGVEENLSAQALGSSVSAL